MRMPPHRLPTDAVWMPCRPFSAANDVTTKYTPTSTGKTSAKRRGRTRNAAAATRPPARATYWRSWKLTPWSCHHHHGRSANVSETAAVVTKRPNCTATGSRPAISAAGTSTRLEVVTTSARAARPSIAMRASGAR